MHPRERDVLPQIGPHFHVADGEVMFAFVIDPTNVLGPRKATEADAKNHPEAWERFTATLERPSSQAEAAESAVPVEPEASPQDTAPAAVVSDAPKRRGRPPKVVAAQ